MVRANYRNAVEGIDYAPEYLERFFRNLLLGEQWDLRNRYLHIHPTDEWQVQPNRVENVAVNVENVTTQKKEFTTQKPLNTTQKRILDYLQYYPKATRKEIAVALGDITENGVKFNIGMLKQRGALKRTGGRKAGEWVVLAD